MRETQSIEMAKQRKRILLFPNGQSIKARRKRLPVFEPHDLRSLTSEAKGKSDDFADLRALRRRNELQMKELLERLGLDPTLPDAWQRGFFSWRTTTMVSAASPGIPGAPIETL
jgi:hypothetical protein